MWIKLRKYVLKIRHVENNKRYKDEKKYGGLCGGASEELGTLQL